MSEVDMTDYQKVGARIRETRVQQGMSQADLSFKSQISLPHISDIELGKTQMKLATFIKIAEALQTSTDWLLRPNIPHVNVVYQTEFQEILGDCSPGEIDSILKIVQEVKSSMHTKKNSID